MYIVEYCLQAGFGLISTHLQSTCMYVKLYFNTLTSTIIYNWFLRSAYTHKELNVNYI